MTVIPATQLSSIHNTYDQYFRNISSSEEKGRVLRGLLSYFEPYTPSAEKLITGTTGVGKIILGLIATVGGTISGSLWKDNTAADWGSKIIMVLGLVFAAFGIKDLVQINKKTKEQLSQVESPRFDIDEAKASLCRQKEKDVINNDPVFFKPLDLRNIGSLRGNVSNPALANQANELLNAYSDSGVSGFISGFKGHEPDLGNISNETTKVADFKDRVAYLLGYVIGAGINTTNLPAHFQNIQLIDEITSDAATLLPNDFVKIFKIARFYKNYLYQKDDTVSIALKGNSVTPEAEIKNLDEVCKGPVDETKWKSSHEYLKNLQVLENSIKTVKSVIDYVVINIDSDDPQIRRNVGIYTQALICAFDIKVSKTTLSEAKFELKTKLEAILRGQSLPVAYLGLDKKLEELETQQGKVDKVLAQEKSPFKKKEHTDPDFKDLTLKEIVA